MSFWNVADVERIGFFVEKSLNSRFYLYYNEKTDLLTICEGLVFAGVIDGGEPCGVDVYIQIEAKQAPTLLAAFQRKKRGQGQGNFSNEIWGKAIIENPNCKCKFCKEHFKNLLNFFSDYLGRNMNKKYNQLDQKYRYWESKK